MATCKYCGQSAGWFSDHHDECLERYQSALAAVSNGVAETLKIGDNGGLEKFKHLLQSIDKPAALNFSDLCLAAIESWQRVVDDACYTDRNALELTGEQIAFYLQFYQTVFSWLDPLPSNFRELIARYSEQVMSLKVGDVIRRACVGEGVERLAMGDPTVDSINYLPGEFPVFVVEDVRIETQQTTYVRNYGGPSVRVAPGLYWRIGRSQSQARTSLVLDPRAGHLVLTNVGVYYSSGTNTLYIPCAQIMKRQFWCPANNFSTRAALGIILNLRNGKLYAFQMGSALQSLAFVKLLGLASAGLVHPKKEPPKAE